MRAHEWSRDRLLRGGSREGLKSTTKGKVSQIAPATLFCCRLLHISPQSYSVTPCDNEVLQSVAV